MKQNSELLAMNYGQSIVLSTFGCIGKTTFAKKYPEIALDIEAVPYKYVYPEYGFDRLKDMDHEALKGAQIRTDNPNFPNNYVDEVVRNLGRYAFVLIVLSPESLEELERRKVAYSIVYPDLSARASICERARQRGNNQDFVDKLDRLLSTTDERDFLQTNLHPECFFTLNGDEYLENLIRREFVPDLV